MVQQIISGLETGSWYSLVGLAIVVIMKSTDVPNFAMAEMGLTSAYVAWWLGSSLGWPFPVAVLGGLVFAALLGIVLEFVLLRPLSGASHFPTLLMTIGLTFGLNAGTALVFGTGPKNFSAPWSGTNFDLGGNIISASQLVTISVGVVVVVLLSRFFTSSWGAQMRAIAEDRTTARLLGISAGRVSSLAWAIGSLMAGMALILATSSTVLSPSLGNELILKGFVAAVLGGFTSMRGTFIGGLLLGVMENMAGSYISTSSKSAIALVVVFLVLLWRPSGFFAVARAREV